MMQHLKSSLVALLGAAALASAQLAEYKPQDSSSSGISYSVNIPSSTASSNSGPIYFQLVAPSGTEWLALGQGSRMSGSNIFVMYSASSSNITLSPRTGTGHVQPQYNSNAQITLLEGTGISSDGVMTANVRCDNCLSWSGGSMNPSSSSSSWIWAVKRGSALSTSSTSASISQHDEEGSFSMNLPAGTGGSSSNPFISGTSGGDASASASSSQASSTGTATASSSAASSTATDSSSPSSAPSSSSSSSSSGSSGSDSTSIRGAHGVIMSLAFLIFIPTAALTVYSSMGNKILMLHGPLQVLNICLLIAGLACGVVLARPLGLIGGYHQVIGYVVIAGMVLFQPLMGIAQHLYFRRTGARSVFGHMHRWLGRALMLLGVINGGLGLQQTGSVGSTYVPRWAVILYSVIAVVAALIYVGMVVGSTVSKRHAAPTEKGRGHGRRRHHASRARDDSEES